MAKHDTVDGTGAVSTTTDPNLMRASYSFGRIVFAKHVDEVVGAASTPEVRDWFKATVEAEFKLSCFGEWDTVLGFGVRRNREQRTVGINAQKLINDAVKKRGLKINK